ncbi:hypothetical protein LTR84_006218 [Exophiala bonariae]|uniref:F-box domain-containing protein n=1 Tax=Exophiala bonariae TaxID=1690606 RepID=A0AAV9N432_9EURO|nr:hypothetical protein LTR84_006218 [Exophiala bonariae]
MATRSTPVIRIPKQITSFTSGNNATPITQESPVAIRHSITGMQLRRSIIQPDRYDEEIMVTKPRSTTKPAYPDLMASQVVAFNPDQAPAAFPSRPLNSRSTESNAGESGALSNTSEAREPKHSHRRSAYVRKDLRTISEPLNYEDFGVIATAEQKEARSRDLWHGLPLSLKYHIYKHLAVPNSRDSILKSLGISEKHFREIQALVALRLEWPATVTEIWDECANNNHLNHSDDSIVSDPSSIDPDIFRQNLDAMVFASNYEVAYESEILRAKQFLKSRNLPTSILGIWVPDCSDSKGTEFFRNIPKELIKFTGINTTTRDIIVGEVAHEARPTISRAREPNNQGSPRGILKNVLFQPLNLQAINPVETDSTVQRGRHPLATVTSVEAVSSTLAGEPGDLQQSQQDLNPSLPGGTSQDETQHKFDQRSSGVMQLRDRNSIPPARAATPYYLDSGSQHIYDIPVDEGGSTLEQTQPDTVTLPDIPGSGFLSFKFKRKQDLTKIFADQPEVYISGNIRTHTPHPATHGEGQAHPTLVTLKISPEKLRLVHANRVLQSPTDYSTSPSTEGLAASNQALPQHSWSLEGPASFDAQLPSRKRKADFIDTSDVLVKRARLMTNDRPIFLTNGHDSHISSTSGSLNADLQPVTMNGQASAPPPAQPEILAQSIETDDNVLPSNLNHRVSASLPDEAVPNRPAPIAIVPSPRDFDRAPSFSPIPENAYLEEFPAFLGSSKAGIDRGGSGLAMHGMIAMLPIGGVEATPRHTRSGPAYIVTSSRALPMRNYGGRKRA